MPIYEFKCSKCGARFERLISLSRINEVKCSSCGSSDIVRLMSTFASHIAGGSSHSSSCSGCASGNCGLCNCSH